MTMDADVVINLYDRALADWRLLGFIPRKYTKEHLEEMLDAAPTGGDFAEAIQQTLDLFD